LRRLRVTWWPIATRSLHWNVICMPMRNPVIDCRAILFDLDGVLVDSTSSIERVWTRWARERGLDPATVIQAAHGRPTLDTLTLVAPELDAQTEVQILAAAELGELDGTVAIAGAANLLARLRMDQWAIVTSGNESIAKARLCFVGLAVPPVLVTADMVARGKPFPDGYLIAAESLGVAPRECIVMEDSPPGIQAARAAGMRSVAVTTTHERAALRLADDVVSGLSEIHVRTTASGRTDVALDKLEMWIE
jgi:mannitol-1-/sugar-/sorbitol-6-phosphatase